jgi:hypothetical protein
MLTKARALQIIREAEREGRVVRRPHFNLRLRQRRYSVLDASLVIRTGRIEREPRWSEKDGNYEVRLRGRCYDGRDTRVVLGVTESGLVAAVSIVTPRKRQRGR